MTITEILDIACTVGIRVSSLKGEYILCGSELQLTAFAETLAVRASSNMPTMVSEGDAVPSKPTFEWQTPNNGQHRLVSSDRTRCTGWAGYRQTTYLDGYIGSSPFFMPGEDGAVTTPEEYALGVSVTELKERGE